MTNPLENQTFVITRPRRQVKTLARKIEEQGGNIFLFPAIDITFILSDAEKQKLLEDILKFDYVLFTSVNAAYAIEDILDASAFKPKTVLAIGPATKLVLNELGILDVYSPFDPSSEGMLECRQFQKVEGKHIAIMGGVGGRQLLLDELPRRGAMVEKFETYRREMPSMPAEKLNELAGLPKPVTVICMAKSALLNFNKLMGEKYSRVKSEFRLLVVTPKLRDLAVESGWQDVVVSKNASDVSILEAV